MTIGIIPNISKKDILLIVKEIIEKITGNGFNYVLCKSLLNYKDQFDSQAQFDSSEQLCEKCDMVLSIGGDGTMLNTAYEIRHFSTPILGVNYGKLGFLAEFDITSFTDFLQDIKTRNYTIEERMALTGGSDEKDGKELYAINDIVIDKGPWPKMINLTIKIDDDYVSTFSADGLIIATPTGSTGYSLSAGGPIINPRSDVITLSPVAPHTLTMRPLIISSLQKITVMVNSPSDKIQVSSDGQRVDFYKSPLTIKVEKDAKPVKLVHSNRINYYEILRNKLYWGLDVRKRDNI